MSKGDLSRDLPPKVPDTIGELTLALMLLGHRTKGPVRGQARSKLEALLGTYPTEAEANRWKRSLKIYRFELETELGPEANGSASGWQKTIDIYEQKAISSPRTHVPVLAEDLKYMCEELRELEQLRKWLAEQKSPPQEKTG